ncbi:hypothetical protein FEK30_15100 [Picosynechococcus sp. PCC 11901]|uniref:DUF7925 domain-containing protein n=1 Tax=Picosynechococcus sp. PCC 11901 TaxID=2579791 RepID=UPI0010FC021D|nr:hypothetical protein [Picosynechococcus sp. PCC 11901]QCS50646.1 hypothetical protein FEK30_15100 [Picosynechococcus sp. PCC 11901]
MQLGDTGPNDGSPLSQNQADDGQNGDVPTATNEVRTVGTDAVNGDREAADTSEPLIVNQEAPRPLALATVLKSVGSVNPGPTGDIDDDVITYNLSFRVESELPFGYEGNFTPAGLTGTDLNFATDPGTLVSGEKYVLVSDAKPFDAEFANTLPIAPANWTIVYTTSPLTTPALSDGATTGAEWTTVRPTDASTITRIGFVYNTTQRGPIATGTTVTGFTLQATNAQATTVRNLAQIFGQTNGDPDNNIVFDESGDQNPNNFLEDTPSNDDPYGDYDPALDLGDPNEEDGSDPNDGTPNDGGGNDTEKGEPNELDLDNPTPQPDELLNGPLEQPGATGPEGTTNDDFVEKSITESVTSGETIENPDAVIFDNTVANNTSFPITNVVLRPISPTEANQVCAACDYSSVDVDGTEIDIPDGTIVTITLPVQTGVGAVQTATYEWQAETNPGEGTFDLTSAAQVSIPTLAAGQSLNYTVTVDLPGTDVVNAFDAYSIPVIAYVNNDENETFDFDAEGAGSNIKIDRLYAGYLKLTKEVQVRYADGTPSGFFTDGSQIDPQPGPGDTLEYRITYENIATPATGSGTGNILLPANNVIVQDSGISGTPGNTGSGNNWALDNDSDGVIDTSHVTNGATAQFGTIQFFNGDPATAGIQQVGTTAATDVTQYINNVGTVVPGGEGTFTFQREIN